MLPERAQTAAKIGTRGVREVIFGKFAAREDCVNEGEAGFGAVAAWPRRLLD